MDTGEPSLSSSQPLSISFSCWLWVEVSDMLYFCVLLLHFLVFQLWHFDFSLIKAPLAFCSLYIWNFGFDSPQINISKEPKGRFRLILNFWPLSQKRRQHFEKLSLSNMENTKGGRNPTNNSWRWDTIGLT